MGGSWAALGRLLGALGRSWAALGRFWAALGLCCQKSMKFLGLATFFRIKPRKNRGFKSKFVLKPRFLREKNEGALEGGIGRRQVGGARGGDLGELPAATWGFYRNVFPIIDKSLRSRPLVEPKGSVAGSSGAAPPNRPLSLWGFVDLA